MKRIRQKTVDLTNVRLSAEEGFVLSRVDGTTTMKELVALTGLDEPRVVDIVGHLRDAGVIELDDDPPAGAPREPAAGARGSEAPGIDGELLAFLRGDAEPADETEHDADAASEADDASASTAEADGGADDGEVAAPADEGDAAAAPEHEARTEREYRKIYETVYHPMTRDERVAAAADAAGAHLLALCLDADPQVIHAVFTNPRVTFECPRLVATHHRTPIGLEHVAKRSDFLADALVQRRLLRNPQLPGTILNRMVNPKLMMEVYKIAVDREIPERSRVMTREVLRKKFMLSSSDERAALLFKTEGRCLILLVNCSLDAHATQILCSKSTYTVLFIQNLARWSATPPALLAHLLKMPVVRRNQGLRKMLLKHPNTPSDVKRGAL
ncbi:MAG: hypothetical protein KIS78_03675 [Labilithrix sp.]|nr:hypothetical protein [Labilithrix sp.]